MLSIPRALPPVTHGSALQAPKRIEVLYDATSLLTGQMLHIALCCLEGSTMSNLVHRRRRCARIVLHSILCLEGSTPEDRSGASTPGKGYRCGSRGAFFLLPTAAILFSGGLEGPARQNWELRHRAAAKTRLEQRPMTEGPRR